MAAPDSLFIRACKRQPVERTPVWFMRQAGRYMAEYRASPQNIFPGRNLQEARGRRRGHDHRRRNPQRRRRHHLCRPPSSARSHGAALSFFAAARVRSSKSRPDRREIHRLAYRSCRRTWLRRGRLSRKSAITFGDKLPVIGFCGAPFTLASYMIEGGGSRNYIEVKKADVQLAARVGRTAGQARRRSRRVHRRAGEGRRRRHPDFRQLGRLPERRGLPSLRSAAHDRPGKDAAEKADVPIIYFGTDSSTLLPSMRETGAEVIGLDWRIPLDEGWASFGHAVAVQGNLDPGAALRRMERTQVARRVNFAIGERTSRPHLQPWARNSAGNSGAERESALAKFVREYSSSTPESEIRDECPPVERRPASSRTEARRSLDRRPEYLRYVTGGRALSPNLLSKKCSIAIR